MGRPGCWRRGRVRTAICCASSNWWNRCRNQRRWRKRPDMSRLVVVSNRVAPITEGEPTAGGLAAGVLDALKQQGGIWFGWSGEITDDAVAAAHVEHTVGSITLYTVDLTRRDYDEFYRGFANGTLWPTLHYQISHARFDWAEFAGYRRANALFAQALARLL